MCTFKQLYLGTTYTGAGLETKWGIQKDQKRGCDKHYNVTFLM